jgi:glycosyltransferase involved in cell wall biosynthesis
MNKTVLMVGNFLSTTHGVRGVGEELALRLPPLGWPVVTTSCEPRRWLRLFDMLQTAWRLRATYAVAQVDVFSGAAFLWAEAVCGLLQWVGKPYVLTLHGGNLPAFARRWPRRVRRLLASAVTVTAPSGYLREQLRAYRADIRMQPNPLELACYPFRWRTEAAPRLIWLRAFHHMYNPTLAPKVLARLIPEFPALTLTMIGPDKGDGSLAAVRETAAALGVAERITYTGAVPKPEVGVYLNRGDIFLNTTNVDNTPVSVLEAQACGLCVVSTEAGGLPYLLEHETNALLVPVGEVEAMAAAVRRLLTEPALAAHLSKQARLHAARFDWTQILPQWDALLTQVVARTERQRA